MNAKNEIISLIAESDPIPKDKILSWMSDGDHETRGALYELTDVAWRRVQPELTMNEQCAFMRRYLIECLDQNPNSDNNGYIHSGFEAAWEIAAWMRYLIKLQDTEPVLKEIAQDLENLYRRADDSTRSRIVTGALEHILEEEGLVKYFNDWQYDPVLIKAYEPAMEWGKAHTNDQTI